MSRRLFFVYLACIFSTTRVLAQAADAMAKGRTGVMQGFSQQKPAYA